MEKKVFFLKLLGFTESETEAFAAVLTLSESHLSHTWRIVSDEGTQVHFFVLAHRENSKQTALNAGLPAELCLWCDEHPNDDQHHILCNDNSIPRISSLTKILNHIAETLGTEEPAAVPQNTIVNTGPYLDPQQGLLKQLLQPQAEPLQVQLKAPSGRTEIYLHPAQNVYFCHCELKQLSSYFSSETELSSQSLTTSQFDAAKEQAARSTKPISDLIWYAAFHLSQGRLLKGHSNQDIVYLTNWPNLEIPGCQKYVRLAAFMQNNAVSLETVTGKTGFPIESVYNFYNACSLVGLVEQAEKTELHEKNLTENDKNLLTTIAARLKDFHQK